MAFKRAHAFTLGFLLLMASGGAEALYGYCYSPSGSYRGPCLSHGLCKDACVHDYKGNKSKPFTDGKCSVQFLPKCICSIFCISSQAEQDDPKKNHHHHHPPTSSEGPEPSPPEQEPLAQGGGQQG